MMRKLVVLAFFLLLSSSLLRRSSSAAVDILESSIVFFIDLPTSCAYGRDFPNTAQIDNFERFWIDETQKNSLPWFYKTCSYSKDRLVRENHVVYKQRVPIQCSGTTPYSYMSFNLTRQCGFKEIYALQEAAQKAWETANGSPMTFKRRVIGNAPMNCGWYGTATWGCPGKYCYVWGRVDRTFPESTGSWGGKPFMNNFVHEIGHTLSLSHSSDNTWEYGDCSDPMGCASFNDVCHSAVYSRKMGWSKPVVDVNDFNMPLNLWVPYAIPVFSKSSVNHVTVSTKAWTDGGGGTVLYLSMRSKDAAATTDGFDEGLMDKFNNMLSIHQFNVSYDLVAQYDSGATPLVCISGVTELVVLKSTRSDPYLDSFLQRGHIAIKVTSLDKSSGARIAICKYVSSPSDCRSIDHFAEEEKEASVPRLFASASAARNNISSLSASESMINKRSSAFAFHPFASM